MNSGTCTPLRAPGIAEDGRLTGTEHGHGRNPTAGQRAEMRACGFRSDAGLELADNLQCQVSQLLPACICFAAASLLRLSGLVVAQWQLRGRCLLAEAERCA